MVGGGVKGPDQCQFLTFLCPGLVVGTGDPGSHQSLQLRSSPGVVWCQGVWSGEGGLGLRRSRGLRPSGVPCAPALSPRLPSAFAP